METEQRIRRFRSSGTAQQRWRSVSLRSPVRFDAGRAHSTAAVLLLLSRAWGTFMARQPPTQFQQPRGVRAEQQALALCPQPQPAHLLDGLPLPARRVGAEEHVLRRVPQDQLARPRRSDSPMAMTGPSGSPARQVTLHLVPVLPGARCEATNRDPGRRRAAQDAQGSARRTRGNARSNRCGRARAGRSPGRPRTAAASALVEVEVLVVGVQLHPLKPASRIAWTRAAS